LSTLSALDVKNNYERQLKLEEESYNVGAELVESTLKKIPQGASVHIRFPKTHVMEWHRLLVPAIKTELSAESNPSKTSADNQKNAKILSIVTPFLSLLSVEQLSAITIGEVLRMYSLNIDKSREGSIQSALDVGEVKGFHIVLGIGKAVEKEYNISMMKKRQNRKLVSH